MRKIDQLLNEYGESHQNAFNKKVHWVCVPLIFWSIVALIASIPPSVMAEYSIVQGFTLNWAYPVLVLITLYYLRLSIPLAFGMLLFGALCIVLTHWVESLALVATPIAAVVVFALAWIGQFYGHKIEGKKPSFLKDVQFLLIGPAWLMHFIFKKVGIAY